MKVSVTYGTVVKGKWGPELVKEGATPTVEVDEEGNETQVYDYSDRLEVPAETYTRKEGQYVTVIVIDGYAAENAAWKAIGQMLS